MLTQNHKAIVKQFARFIVSGGTAAAVGLLTVYILTDILKVWYLASSIVSFLVTFVTAFLLQKFWTFQNHEMTELPKQASFSLGVAIGNFFINAGLMYGLVDILKLHYFLSQFITYAFFGLVDFFIYRLLIFKA